MLLLRNLSQVVTMKGGGVPRTGRAMSDLGVIENGAILVHGGRIVWVGPTRDVPAREPGVHCQTVDGLGLDLVALPGFIDPHTHPLLSAPKPESRQDHSGPAESGGEREEALRAAAQNQTLAKVERFARLFLTHGTTTIEAKSVAGSGLDEGIRSLEVLAALRERSRLEIHPTFLCAPAAPGAETGTHPEQVQQTIRTALPRVAREGLARFCDCLVDDAHYDVAEARSILRAAAAAGLGLRVHAEESGPGAAASLAAETGAGSADHLQWIDDAGIEALSRSGTVATLLPATASHLGGLEPAPARRLIAAGVPVALATGFYPGSCHTLNMQLVVALAAARMGMTPEEAITAATVNAACSLGIADRVGTLEPDRQADIVLMNVGHYREIATFFGVNHCVVTVKNGNVVIDRLEHP